jgi:hypothetical protein
VIKVRRAYLSGLMTETNSDPSLSIVGAVPRCDGLDEMAGKGADEALLAKIADISNSAEKIGMKASYWSNVPL